MTSGLCIVIAGIVLLGCSDAAVYTLYRNSVAMEGARLHVATFDATDGEEYNSENCEAARDLFQRQAGVRTRFWCEKESFVADAEGAGGVAMMKRMNGWNRLFIAAAVCWVLVAPFLAMKAANDPVDRVVDMCGTSAYRNYGASDSIIRLDMDQYHAEVKKCLDAWTRDVVSPQKLFSALIGTGDRMLFQMAWGLILIPLCLLWVVGWVLGKTVKWIAAGFRQT